MKAIKIRELAGAIAGSCISGNQEVGITGVSIDSRTAASGMVFFALKGERFDGHDFLEQAIEAGCCALVISKALKSVLTLAGNKGVAVIKVKDTLDALQDFAAYYLSLFPINKIGVTGSTGKTTTKEMLYRILSEKYITVRNEGNFNNNIGLPLSVFQIDDTTETAVFEMGMDRPGEIHRLAEILRPQIGIITNVGLSHIQNLGSRENILKAKMEIADFFGEKDVLIINLDNDMLSKVSYDNSYRILSVGSSDKASFHISQIVGSGEEGIRFTLTTEGDTQEFHLGIPGMHNGTNAALAVAAARCLGVSFKEAAKGLAKLSDTDKRMHIIETRGIKIIDDTYNASPDSMKAAIDVLVDMHGGRKIAILGDMFELGEEEVAYHFQIGEYTSHAGIDMVISVGKNAKYISEGARKEGAKAIHFEAKDLLKGVLDQWIRQGDVILVKGSRGMAMEEIVQLLEKTEE